MKNITILFISFFILSSCSLLNNRSELRPVASDKWQIKTSPATLSGWTALDFSSSDNYYAQASYQCDQYEVLMNTIPKVSYTFYGSIFPLFPVYYKTNKNMSLYLHAKQKDVNFIEGISDCPSLATHSEKNKKEPIQSLSGENNLCRYQLSSAQINSNLLNISFQDEKNHCEIENLKFTRRSHLIYCPLCFGNIATLPVHDYQSTDPAESETESSTEYINSHKTAFKNTVAITTGGIVGAIAGLYASSVLFSCTESNFGHSCDLTSVYFGLMVGTYAGSAIAINMVDDKTGAQVNLSYPF